MDSIQNKQRDIYRENFLAHGDKPEGVLWNNKETQYLRFERLLKNFDISSPFSIHDIGSGTCSLHEYLLNNNTEHEYYCTELVSEMIALAKKKFPDLKIFEGDILTNKDITTCDIVTASGTFNMKSTTPKDTWKDYVFSSIKRMYEICDKGISFNLLTSYNTFESPELAYFDPKEVFDFCMKNLSRFVVLDHAYPLFEFTITVYKQETIKQAFPGKDYDKYFAKKA